MKKLKNLFVLLLMTLSMTLVSQIPNNFTISEDIVSIGTDFGISSINGRITEKIVTIGTDYTLKIDGKKIAVAKQQIISLGSKVNIYDEFGDKIGSIEEIIIESLFSIYSRYNIYDARGNKVAYSEKHSLMSTTFTIKSNSGTVCTIERPMINVLSDSWKVKFKDTNIDKRLIIFIPCYKTNRDNK